MNKELYDLGTFTLKTAKKAGADECRINIQGQRFVTISYRNRKPENIKEASTRGLAVEIYVNGRYSRQSTSDIRKDALEKFISNAVEATKLLAEDPYRTLPDPRYYEGRKKIDLKILDPGHESYTPEERHKLVKEIEDSCLTHGGEKVISVTASAYDSYNESLMMTTNGFEGYRESTTYQAGAQMSVQDKGDRRPADGAYAIAVLKRSLPGPEEIGKEAARRTLDLLGAKKVKTGTLPVVIENRNVARLFGGFLEAMLGYNIQQKRSFLAEKKNEKVAAEILTLIDDPFLESGLGSRLYDGDGFAAKKRKMIEDGVLKEFYIDWYYSRKLGWEPTTGSPSNLIIPQGKRSVREIMKDLGRGILITGFIGGNSNSTTGDASIGILGKLFENGEPVQSIAEMNIADNHLKFWQKLVEVADDPWPYSPFRTPSMVFKDVVVSGL